MNLVVVESPTKARTLSRFLGSSYKIVASMGHIRDLPKSDLGVDTENGFTPRYIIPRDKSKNVKLLSQEAKGKNNIFLATDPDREGEAIAYHVRFLLNSKAKIPQNKFQRIVFHEITKGAIEEALKNPRDIDLKLYDAQQARRVLDRLVGYKLSPLLWYKIKKGLSAGRVQSVAVRIIVDREREIAAFKPVEYWTIKAELEKNKESFIANLVRIKEQKAEIKNKTEADKIFVELNKAQYLVSRVEKKEVKRNAAPPFTTSTLQQSASNKFNFTSKQTMRLAQDLYEEGFITYHRTDSLNVALSAVSAVRDHIEKVYGREFLPEKPLFYKTKAKGAQEAHEAVRPTQIEKKKEEIGLTDKHQKLYEIIRQRFVASQMKEALYSQTSVEVSAGQYLFRAVGTLVVFPGWRQVYGVKAGDSVSENEEETRLPDLEVGNRLNLLKLLPEQKFTQPPPRYTEAALIKALEEKGIGRPSTYAPTISTIQDRGYILKEERKLKPTELGFLVNDFVVKYFPNIVDLNFTAKMEENLDKIASGELKWVPLIAEFYKPFEKEVEEVKETAKAIERPVVKTGEACPKCGSPLVEREGKFGKFVGCSTYPNCKYTKNIIETINVPCPKCGGEIVVKRTKRGKVFYGCSNYPKCDFASWQKPNLAANGNPDPSSKK